MKKRTKQGLKIAGWTLGGLLMMFLLVVAGLMHFVFTPEKLTPVVLQIANQALDAELKLKKVEVTFFSTFPRFGLRVEEGTLISKSLHMYADSLSVCSLQRSHQGVESQEVVSDNKCFEVQSADSLLAFRECVLTVNPLDYFVNHKVTVHQLLLKEAKVYAYRNREGRANWDIVPASTDRSEAACDTVSARSWRGEIDIQQVELQHANVVFDDRNTDLYTRISDANLRLRLSLNQGVSLLKLDFDNRNLLFWQQGQLLVNQLATALKAEIEVDHSTAYWTLKQTELTLNGVRLDVNGTLQRDTATREVDLDLTYGLHAPSVETVLNMIPNRFVRHGQVKADGAVHVNGTVKGRYGNHWLPAIALHIQIKDAKAQYAGMPYGIDLLTADFDSYVDLMRNEPSYVNLKIFRFKGAHTDVLATMKVDDLLSDPLIQLHTESTVNLDALAKTFPLQEGVVLRGELQAGVDLQCRLSSLKKQDIGRVRLDGQLVLSNFELKDTAKDFSFYGNADFHFSGKESLEAELEIRKLLWQSRRFHSEIEQMKAKVTSSNPQDSTRVVALQADVEMSRLRAGLGDTLAVYSGRTKAFASLAPNPERPDLPVMGVNLRTDSLFLRVKEHRLGLQVAGMKLNAEKIHDSLWVPRGMVGFDRLLVHSPVLDLPVRLRKTAVTIDGPRMTLKNASLQLGHTDLVATGDVWGLYRSMTRNEVLKARLSVSSQLIDCNQLVQALSVSADSLQQPSVSAAHSSQSQVTPDSISEGMKLFILPQKVDFELQTDFKKVIFEQMVFEDVQGRMDLKQGILHMSDLHMRAMEADMRAVLVYHADSIHGGYTGFDFKIKDINVGKLVDFIPSMDSIVPMLRSFKGRVQFDVAAEAKLDSSMNIRIPSLRAAMHIKGDSLVLMDGETFAEISKMLMFKNKKRNVFDSISVNVVVNDGSVVVYPFQVTLDRYKAAVGGKQGLDMNFDYHISILKSPLPFKAGVNISGTPDKMKFRLGKAKYKDDVTPAAIRRVDSTRTDLGKRIVERFQRLAKGRNR